MSLKFILTICLLACVTSQALAQAPATHAFTFYTEPAGAEVSVNRGDGRATLLGHSGEVIALTPAVTTAVDGGSSVAVTFSLDGYFPLTERIPSSYFQQRDRWPLTGVRHLDAVSGWIATRDWLRANLVWCLASGLLLAALGTLWGRRERGVRRQLERGRLLQQAVARGDADAFLGQRIGGYLITERAGQGGQARVYRAQPANGGATVAIKIIDPSASQDETYRRRFNREIRICCNLLHRNIVHLLDWGEDDGVLYLVMEWLDGVTLRERLGRQPRLAPAAAAAILLPLLDACEYAHSRGIVHRDLKPENIMLVGPEETVKVVDFGVARGPQHTTVTASGMVVGTINYLAPERLQDTDTEPRSDQYSVGVIAYEMLAGQRPFDSDDGTVLENLYRKAPALCEVQPDLGQGLSDVIGRMMSRDLHQRYVSDAEARAALAAVLDVPR